MIVWFEFKLIKLFLLGIAVGGAVTAVTGAGSSSGMMMVALSTKSSLTGSAEEASIGLMKLSSLSGESSVTGSLVDPDACLTSSTRTHTS